MQPAKAQTSLHKCLISPEPLLLAHTMLVKIKKTYFSVRKGKAIIFLYFAGEKKHENDRTARKFVAFCSEISPHFSTIKIIIA